MRWNKYVCPALLMLLLTAGGASPALAQNATDSLKVTGSLPKNPLPPPATSGQIPLSATSIGPQTSPDVAAPNSATAPFEHNDSVASLPRIFTVKCSTWSMGPSR